MKINALTGFILLLLSYNSFAATHQVGPSGPYLSPNMLYTANVVQDGDTIEIAAATYVVPAGATGNCARKRMEQTIAGTGTARISIYALRDA